MLLWETSQQVFCNIVISTLYLEKWGAAAPLDLPLLIALWHITLCTIMIYTAWIIIAHYPTTEGENIILNGASQMNLNLTKYLSYQIIELQR